MTLPPPSLIDVFTRIDNQLDEVIKLLKEIRDRLPVAPTLAPPTVPTAPPTVPTVPLPTVVRERYEEVVSPYRLILMVRGLPVGSLSFLVTSTEFKKIDLMGDVAILTADDDIYIAHRVDASPFKVFGGVYLVFTRHRRFSEVYVKAVAGSTNVYVWFFRIEGED